MKYIEKHYQDLIEQLESSHSYVVDDLKAHINWLEKKLADYENAEAGIAKELEEYNRLENESSESCPGCDARISELVEQVEALKKENKSLRMSNGHLKSTKVKKTKTYKKNVVCLCKDCKKYFQACRKDAMRCADCKRKHAAELTKIYRAKQ